MVSNKIFSKVLIYFFQCVIIFKSDVQMIANIMFEESPSIVEQDAS